MQFGGTVYPVPRDVLEEAHGQTVTVGSRPEDLETAPQGEGLQVEVDVVENSAPTPTSTATPPWTARATTSWPASTAAAPR